MNDPDLTLDIPDPQVLAIYPHDANGVTHHHRILLNKLSPGRWVCLTPDHELQILDLTTVRHEVLGRRARFPQHLVLADVIYSFDPLTRNELESFRRRAKTMNVILGEGDQEEIAALVWVFSDPLSSKLGEVVSDDMVARAVVLGSRGLVELDGEVVGITEIQHVEVENFKQQQKGSLGDLRCIGNHVDHQKRRFISMADALPLLRESKFDDWGFTGPRAALEFLKSVHEGVSELSGYHLQWVKNSGVNAHSSIVHEHRNLVEILRLGLCRDQLDISNLLAFELAVRRIAQLEVATSRNPSSPEFAGLEVLLENPVSDSGAASTRNLDAWVTEKLKEKANIQKQARLFREEVSHSSRAKAGGADSEGGPWRRKPKAKAKGGGAGATAGDS